MDNLHYPNDPNDSNVNTKLQKILLIGSIVNICLSYICNFGIIIDNIDRYICNTNVYLIIYMFIVYNTFLLPVIFKRLIFVQISHISHMKYIIFLFINSFTIYTSLYVLFINTNNCGDSIYLYYYISIFFQLFLISIISIYYTIIYFKINPTVDSPIQRESINVEPLQHDSLIASLYTYTISFFVYNSITRTIYNDNSMSILETTDTKCRICKLEYYNYDVLVLLNCNHHFHKECGIDWLEQNATCPICFSN